VVGSGGAAVRHDSEIALGGARYGDVYAQTVTLDFDLETANALAQTRDVLIERPDFVACAGALHRRGSARPASCLLAREVLLRNALNDLPALVHPIEQLRLQIHESLAKVGELPHRAQLFGAVGEKVWIIDD
jgi:hypothetical protein